jgi:hypothetical protein
MNTNFINIKTDWPLNINLIKNKYPIDIYVDIIDIEQNDNYKVFIIAEPYCIVPHVYDFIKKNHNIFSLIITYDDEILKYPNSIKCLYGTKFVDETPNIIINNKISFILGSKLNANGHKLRHDIYYNFNKINKNLDIYISSLAPIENLYNNQYIGNNINSKNLLFNDYSYHLCIENSKQNNYFTEKIMDCFQTMTVPIYWGCLNINEFFDINGIIILNTNNIDEIVNTINSIDLIAFYKNNIEAIKNNYEICLKYLDYQERLINIINNLK